MWWCGGWFALLWVGSTATLLTNDGVSVTETGSARVVAGVWSVVTVIQRPRVPEIRGWIQGLDVFLNRIRRLVDPQDQQQWKIQRAMIADRMRVGRTLLDGGRKEMDPVRMKQRAKRGLIDGIGMVGKFLFGIATSDDIEGVEKAVQKLARDTATIHHRETELLSVVNATRMYVRENREDIMTLENITTKLFTLAGKTERHVQSVERIVRKLQLLREMDRAVNLLEAVSMGFVAEAMVFHRQLGQLEGGGLTRDLLPQVHLAKIKTYLRQGGHAVLNDHWYYRHSVVAPLWTTGGGGLPFRWAGRRTPRKST
jgi:hypothetical protein